MGIGSTPRHPGLRGISRHSEAVCMPHQGRQLLLSPWMSSHLPVQPTIIILLPASSSTAVATGVRFHAMEEGRVAVGPWRSMGRAALLSASCGAHFLHSPHKHPPPSSGDAPTPSGDGVFLAGWHGASWAELTSGMLERAWGCQALTEAGGRRPDHESAAPAVCPEARQG